MDPQITDVTQQVHEQPDSHSQGFSQVLSALQGGKSVLVTVSTDPSVDELSSAIGITLLLSKLGKHATAVFSGKIPPAMEFLDPEKTFEDTVDSLRDFIIALDKEKADKLRYKVEDDVVKVFITPYKTVLSEKDLMFSQGDFNVDVVLALGVSKREDLDKAIIAHGRILHDATVITVTNMQSESTLGSINWNESKASSVAEMLASLSPSLGADLVDGQISTAYLTGIVAETSRFSNDKTSPKVMNIAAQLMAVGANQQLIASNLRHQGVISEPIRDKDSQPHDDEGELSLDHGDSKTKPDSSDTASGEQGIEVSTKNNSEADGEIKIENNTEANHEELAAAPKEDNSVEDQGSVSESVENTQQELNEDKSNSELSDVESALQGLTDEESKVEPKAPEVVLPSKPEDNSEVKLPEGSSPLEPISPTIQTTHSAPPMITSLHSHKDDESAEKPTFGGPLSATTEIAEEAKAAEAAREASMNNMALSHDNKPAEEELNSEAALEEARRAVEDANIGEPFNPANQPLQSINSQPLPSIDNSVEPDSGVSAIQPLPTPSITSNEAENKNEPDPIESFMQQHSSAEPVVTPLNQPVPATPPLPSLGVDQAASGLPPLPPLPGNEPNVGGLPPLPPLPGQPQSQQFDPAAVAQPQINPSFMQDMPQSQNTWTEASNDLAAQQQQKDTLRQEKMDQMNAQYDQAVDRNRELQGLPPVNNPNGSGLPPLPPV